MSIIYSTTKTLFNLFQRKNSNNKKERLGKDSKWCKKVNSLQSKILSPTANNSNIKPTDPSIRMSLDTEDPESCFYHTPIHR